MNKEIGVYFDGYENHVFFENDDKYYQVNEDGTKDDITKEFIAVLAGQIWDKYTIGETSVINGGYKTELFAPIYDWIDLTLYGYGKSMEESKENAIKLFDEFYAYNEKIEANIQRNLESQMQRVHKFAILPKDRKLSSLEDLTTYYSDMELIFFEDGKEDLRELVVKEGIPDDAHADDVPAGYVDGKDIVFTRWGFIKDEKELYKKAIDKFIPEILKHYNITDYNIYYSCDRYTKEMYTDVSVKKEIVDGDFDYYIPKK